MGLGSAQLESSVVVFRPYNKKAKTYSDMTGLLRPAGGGQNLFKINQIHCRMKKIVFTFILGYPLNN
jgi:hypothetical protein